ncbi:MAG: GNAT family N-acetyltransferase, partial [Pseudomonadota bacterium]
ALSLVLCASIRTLCSADHRGDEDAIARWTANKTPEHLAAWAEDPRLRLFLADRDGDVAGVGCVSTVAEVLLIYVSPDHRFCGVSRTLLGHAEATLVALGHQTAKLTSTITARRFYAANGWQIAGAPVDDFGLECRPMVKDIGSPAGPNG